MHGNGPTVRVKAGQLSVLGRSSDVVADVAMCARGHGFGDSIVLQHAHLKRGEWRLCVDGSVSNVSVCARGDGLGGGVVLQHAHLSAGGHSVDMSVDMSVDEIGAQMCTRCGGSVPPTPTHPLTIPPTTTPCTSPPEQRGCPAACPVSSRGGVGGEECRSGHGSPDL